MGPTRQPQQVRTASADDGHIIAVTMLGQHSFGFHQQAFRVGQLAYFLDKMKTTMDGDASLLEKTLIIWGSPMADPNIHNHRRCPLMLLGHANGLLKGGIHLKAEDGTPMANVMLALLHRLGLEDVKTFGDSTGEFEL